MTTNAAFGLILNLLVIGVIGGLVAIAIRRRGTMPALGSAEWYALQYGLPARLSHDPALERYAQRTRTWRVVGTAASLLAMMAWAIYFVGRDNEVTINPPVVFVIGWFLTGIVPEIFVRNRRAKTVRVAVLSDRRATRFVSPSAKPWLGASLVALLLAGALAATLHTPGSRNGALVPLALTALLAAVSLLAIRRIAARTHPATTADDVLIDDVIRLAATTRVVSGWSTLNFIGALFTMPLGPAGVEATIVTSLSVLFALGAIGCWAWMPTRVAPRASSRPAPADPTS